VVLVVDVLEGKTPDLQSLQDLIFIAEVVSDLLRGQKSKRLITELLLFIRFPLLLRLSSHLQEAFLENVSNNLEQLLVDHVVYFLFELEGDLLKLRRDISVGALEDDGEMVLLGVPDEVVLEIQGEILLLI
jgi:hypothetical protein